MSKFGLASIVVMVSMLPWYGSGLSSNLSGGSMDTKTATKNLVDKIRKDAIVRQDPKCWKCGELPARDGRFGPLYCSNCKVLPSPKDG